jgi:hypothetical protein
MFQAWFVEKIKTRFMFNKFFFENRTVNDNVEIYCTAGQATDDSTAHAHCMLDTYGHKYTLRMCNTYCCSTATIAKRTRPGFRLYVLRLSYLIVLRRLDEAVRR